MLAAREAELAQADAVSDELSLKQAETEFSKAKNHLNRINELYDAGAVTIEELETARLKNPEPELFTTKQKSRWKRGPVTSKKPP